MKRQALDDFLEEMAKKPQTLGWDVVLAFDRNKTNYLLLQDYISRFGATSLFPPVSSSIDPVTGVTHELIGLQLDKPRLSFENAVITESRARCLMRTVGGLVIETVRPQGTTRKEVKRVGMADGLVGPMLTMTINLRNAPGSVGSAGQVELDLVGNGATDFQLSGVDTQFEAVKLGEHLRQEMAKWSDEQKKFELSELRQNPEDALQPGNFVVLTRPAPGATRRDADDFGDGEVLVMVGLDDREGDLPSSDTSMPYLLPQGYSSNLIISYEQYFRRMVMPRIQEVMGEYGVDFKVEEAGNFARFVASSGGIRIPGYKVSPIIGFNWWYGETNMNFPDALQVQVEGDSVRLNWASTSNSLEGTSLYDSGQPQDKFYKGNFSVSWSLKSDFRAVLGTDEQTGRSSLVIEPAPHIIDQSHAIQSQSGDSECRDHFLGNVASHFSNKCYSQLAFLSDKLSGVGQSIDAFRLNGLLFRDEDVVVPRFVALPGDLTILGDISAELTAHRLSPQEVTVAAEGTHAFTVEPAGSSVTWSVAPLPGEEGGEGKVGKISAAGQYTAPTAASFGFSFKRVIVTATDGTWTGKALVHLVAAPVSVFPLVNVVNLSHDTDEGYLVWAGSTNGAAMEWNITGNAGGRLVVADNPDVQGAQRYFGPATFPTDGTNQLDRVLRVDRVEVAQGNGAASVCEMVLTNSPISNYFFKYSEVQGGLQLEFWLTDDEGVQSQVPEAMTKWHKVSGRGQFSDAGLYTFPAIGSDHYIIVAAFHVVPGVPIALWNYVIIPLPLATSLLSKEYAA